VLVCFVDIGGIVDHHCLNFIRFWLRTGTFVEIFYICIYSISLPIHVFKTTSGPYKASVRKNNAKS
jgi:hypothetical protein